MTFGSQWEFIGALQQQDADALVNRSIDAGVNFFDTADVYSSGESEEILGRALAPKRHDVVIATRYAVGWDLGQMMSACRGSTLSSLPKPA